MLSQIYECPGCEDRKLAEYSSISPTLWCSCDGFKMMEELTND